MMNRREFLAPAAAGVAFTIVPRHVLGGAGYVPPSDKVVLAHIGCGTEGTRELVSGLIQDQQIQIVAVCDPVKDGTNYLDWSKNGTRDLIRTLLGDSSFNANVQGIRSGRDQFQEVVQRYYAKTRGVENYKVAAYADFRELLEKEKDIDGVKIMTPDHLHAAVAIAAMRKGKCVAVHKPLANRMNEAKLVLETARKTKVATHLLAPSSGGTADRIAARIKDGTIGTLRQVHYWTNRPVWPQYPELPADRPPVPEGFDWQLWLGPERDRPYHPWFTHMVFRGWYDFGAGCMGDVGYGNLWPVFRAFDLGAPLSARAWATRTCKIVDQVAHSVANDVAYPIGCAIQFEIPRIDAPKIDLFWYDGGLQPQIPELDAETAPAPVEGMLYVGDKGKILSSGGVPRLFTAKGSQPLWGGDKGGFGTGKEGSGTGKKTFGGGVWAKAFKGGAPSPGNFLNAGPIAETVCLGGVALRAGSQKSDARIKVLYDSADMRITNVSEANRFLTREYRPGWEL